MLEAIRKKKEEKEAKLRAEQQAGVRTVLFRTTVKGKGGFVGEETTYSDGTTEMKVITAATVEESNPPPNNNTNANEPQANSAPQRKKLSIVRARLAAKHPVVSLASTVILSAGDKSQASVAWSKLGGVLCAGASYTPTEADVGSTLTVTITFASDGEVLVLETEKVLALLPVRERLIITEGNEKDAIRIGTYNIMAPCHTRLDAYAFADPGIIAIDYRINLFFRELEQYRPALLCLQEVEEFYFNSQFASEFESRGYAWKACFSHKNDRTKEGVVVLWLSDQFELENHVFVDSSSLKMKQESGVEKKTTEASLKSDSANKTSKTKVKDATPSPMASLYSNLSHVHHHNNFNAVILREKTTEKRIALATTHLLFTSSWPLEQVYQMQLIQLSHYLEAFQSLLVSQDPSNSQSIPILFCGDFNNSADSKMYRFIRDGNTTLLDQDNDANLMLSAYASRPEGELKATNFTEDWKGTLDYIWYTPSTLTLRAVVQPYDNAIYQQWVALPNSLLSSDHVSLWCDVAFK